jgi:hypothetical protein
MTVQPGLYTAWKGTVAISTYLLEPLRAHIGHPSDKSVGRPPAAAPRLLVIPGPELFMAWKGAGVDNSIYFKSLR